MKDSTKSTLLTLLRAAVAMAIFVLAVVNYEQLKSIDVRALVDASSSVFLAVLTLWGVYLIKSVLFVIPASLIYISVGLAFNAVDAILINLVGIVLEVTVTYLLGLFLGGDYVYRVLSKNKAGRKLLETQFNNKFIVLLGIRVLPVFPIDFVSLFWGASKCGFFRYFAASLLGIMPRVALFTILGDGIYDYIPMDWIVKIIIAVIPVGVIFMLVKHFIAAKKEQKPGSTSADAQAGAQ